ncbi:ROK family protein [Deinococcus sp. KNUC1210]|uniref:ROK family protein n=1 Tax=Deinococcus sp. KNUC1210 TaxID=2917691 RepID=UPI001EF13595|nr:ROK family protein [Deinococcus sp. KNUC1210]ULH16729.1 ROK family protein [Deinococcus sp. KNUC1210]
MKYDVLDMAAVRVQHSLLLLRLLWQQSAPRIDLSRQVGLSRSAISSIVHDLLAAGLVCEGEARVSASVGRRATMLSLNQDAACLLAVDLGASHLRVALLNLRCAVLASSERPYEIGMGPDATYPLIRQMALEVLEASGMTESRLAAVGVGVPGPVDFRTGEVVRPPNMTGWDGENVARALGRYFQTPVLVDNDANLGVLAEWKFGELQGTPDLIYLKVATGIGAGVLLGGRLHRGVSGGAGEIGHISINEQGPLGRSGNPGSLESYAAAGVVLAKMRTRLHRYPSTALTETSSMSELTRLSHTDPLARELWGEVGRHLGVAITTTLNLFNPAAVVFGGQMAAAGEPLLRAVRQVVEERAMQVNRGNVQIVASTLGRDIGVLGAGVMMLESLLSPEGIGQLTRVSRAQRPGAPAARAGSVPAALGESQPERSAGDLLPSRGAFQLHSGSRAPPLAAGESDVV